MKTIKQTYAINAPVSKVWRALIDPVIIQQWGGGPAKMGARQGSKFTLWGGEIYGTNKEVVPRKKLVQDWFTEYDQRGTKVTFLLKEKGNKTQVELLHENVPDDKYEELDQGWKDYYLGPIKESLES